MAALLFSCLGFILLSSQFCTLECAVTECAVCDGVRFMYECVSRTRCPGSKCYLQVLEDNIGQIIYGGCASANECKARITVKREDDEHEHENHRYASNVPLKNRNLRFLCEECCDDYSRCNINSCGMPLLGLYPGSHPNAAQTTTVMTTMPSTSSTPPPTPSPTPVECETCSGDLCGVVHGTAAKCTADKPYCMNTVVNHAGGQKTVTKTCASVSDCDIKWWHGSASDGLCFQLDMSEIYPFTFTCNFCCVTSNCNTNIIPVQNTMYGVHTSTITTPNPTPATTTTTTTTTTPTPTDTTATTTTTTTTTTPTPTATTTTTTAAPVVPVQCEVCDGKLCGIVPTERSISCPGEKPYCMNTVVNQADGSKLIKKSCASVADCESKWRHGSYLEPTCGSYDLTAVYPFDITCNYCCVTPLCNRGILPAMSTMYKSKYHVQTLG